MRFTLLSPREPTTSKSGRTPRVSTALGSGRGGELRVSFSSEQAPSSNARSSGARATRRRTEFHDGLGCGQALELPVLRRGKAFEALPHLFRQPSGFVGAHGLAHRERHPARRRADAHVQHDDAVVGLEHVRVRVAEHEARVLRALVAHGQRHDALLRLHGGHRFWSARSLVVLSWHPRHALGPARHVSSAAIFPARAPAAMAAPEPRRFVRFFNTLGMSDVAIVGAPAARMRPQRQRGMTRARCDQVAKTRRWARWSASCPPKA